MAKRAVPKTVAAVAALGDRRATLEACRDVLAAALDEASPQIAPQIVGQLRAVLAELDTLTAPPVSVSDELRSRRAARRAAAAVESPASG